MSQVTAAQRRRFRRNKLGGAWRRPWRWEAWAWPRPRPPAACPQTARSSIAHHPPQEKLINDCVHCGFCLPTCPTYLLWREEMDSPRGRIYLMKMGLEGDVERMDQTYVQHFDQCLGCMACVSACPSGVKYDRLIESTRAQIERHYPRPLADRLFRWLIFSLFPHPARLRAMLLPMWLYRRSGLRWLLHRSGLLRLLPERLQAMESLLPEVSLRSDVQQLADAGEAARHAAHEGRAHPGMRAASVFRRCKPGHGAGARRRRLRSDHSARTGLLRRFGHARGP